MKKTLTLNNGIEIPTIGLGTWKLTGGIIKKVIADALTIGYRHIDTAEHYENQKDIAAALDASSIPREELFITSKVWVTDLHREDVYKACQRTLKELKMDYIDLYLIHWPDRGVPFSETLGAMRDLQDRGMVKAIGVSNFTIHHLQDALKTGVQISVNQVEFHPSLYQKELKDFCDKQRIVITAHSSMAQGTELELPIVKELAIKYGRSPAQIILNWTMRKGIAAIPKATTKEFLKDNFDSLDWEMAEEDSQRIDALNLNNRTVSPTLADFSY